MKVLVAFETRHGATAGIAERIASTLQACGIEAEAIRARSVGEVGSYDAYVVGSAAYMFHWLGDASSFVRRNRRALVTKPVWLFSSGPLGTETTDAQGRDQKEVSVPREIRELSELVGARDHRVFFGAYERDRKPIGIAERFMGLLPAAREALPEGDFRDWPDIEAWAAAIARDLTASPSPTAPTPSVAG